MAHFLSKLNVTKQAIAAIIGAVAFGAIGSAYVVDRLNYKDFVTDRTEPLAIRIAMVEETMCLPQTIERLGSQREDFCNMVRYIRRYGLISSSGKPLSLTGLGTPLNNP